MNKNYIKGECHTMLAEYKTPIDRFYSVPQKGDRIKCYYRGAETALTVKYIIHDMVYGEPYIYVELDL